MSLLWARSPFFAPMMLSRHGMMAMGMPLHLLTCPLTADVESKVGGVKGAPGSSAHVYHHPDGVNVDGIIRLNNSVWRLEPADRYVFLRSVDHISCNIKLLTQLSLLYTGTRT